MEILSKWNTDDEVFLQIWRESVTLLVWNSREDSIEGGRSGPIRAKLECSRGKVMGTVFWYAEKILLVTSSRKRKLEEYNINLF